MRVASVARGCRAAVPLGAFLALATLAVVLAAQAQIACTRQITVGTAMPSMPGMDMSAMPMTDGAISLCPIVLVLSITAVVLTLNAAVLLVLDPERGAVSRALADFVVCLPFAKTCGAILGLGAGAVGTMMAIDGTTPSGFVGWSSLGAIVVATAVAAAVIAFALGRFVIALTRRM